MKTLECASKVAGRLTGGETDGGTTAMPEPTRTLRIYNATIRGTRKAIDDLFAVLERHNAVVSGCDATRWKRGGSIWV